MEHLIICYLIEMLAACGWALSYCQITWLLSSWSHIVKLWLQVEETVDNQFQQLLLFFWETWSSDFKTKFDDCGVTSKYCVFAVFICSYAPIRFVIKYSMSSFLLTVTACHRKIVTYIMCYFDLFSFHLLLFYCFRAFVT